MPKLTRQGVRDLGHSGKRSNVPRLPSESFGCTHPKGRFLGYDPLGAFGRIECLTCGVITTVDAFQPRK